MLCITSCFCVTKTCSNHDRIYILFSFHISFTTFLHICHHLALNNNIFKPHTMYSNIKPKRSPNPSKLNPNNYWRSAQANTEILPFTLKL